MRYPEYILKVLGAVAVIMAAFSCVKSDIEYERSGGDISIAPVASAVTKSQPGAITGTTYPQGETMGVFAFHHPTAAPGEWLDLDGVSVWKDMSPWEFGYKLKYGAWGGVKSKIVTGGDGKQTLEFDDSPREWPDEGSLIFAGFSPYYKYDAINQENLGNYVAVKDKVKFDVQSRTLTVTGYTVGQYIPMTAEQIADPNLEYVNESQSDAMFFMPQVQKGHYVGVNKLSAYPARFYHALSLVEFKVRAEDEYTMERVDIDRITLEQVYHTGDFTAKVEDDGSITAGWSLYEDEGYSKNVNIFGDEDPLTEYEDLYLDMQLRSVAQLLIIPGPTHRIKVVCHIYIQGREFEQTYIIRPDEVGIDKWEVGKRYVYNLNLGINRITFSPETYEWNDVDGGGIATQQTNDNQ